MTSLYSHSQRVFVMLIGTWVGIMVAVGLLVPITVFGYLTDKQVAGMVAGQIFKNTGFLSIVFGMILLVISNHFVRRGLNQYRLIRWALLITLVLTMIGSFVIQPWMVAIRENTLTAGFPVLLSDKAGLFKILHGVSSSIFLIELSLLGFIFWRSSKVQA